MLSFSPEITHDVSASFLLLLFFHGLILDRMPAGYVIHNLDR